MTITVVQTGLDAAGALAAWWFAWLVQSVLLTAVGLALAAAARRWGAATQSAIYRTTLVAVLLAPMASAVVCRLGISGWSLPLVGVRNTMDEARRMIRVGAADFPTANKGLAPVADRQLSSASGIPIGLTAMALSLILI